jgi:hypothetical protein
MLTRSTHCQNKKRKTLKQKGGNKEKYIILGFPDIIDLVEDNEGFDSEYYIQIKDNFTPLESFATFIDVANELATTKHNKNVNYYFENEGQKYYDWMDLKIQRGTRYKPIYDPELTHYDEYLCRILHFCYLRMGQANIDKIITVVPRFEKLLKIKDGFVSEYTYLTPGNPFQQLDYEPDRLTYVSNIHSVVRIPETDIYKERHLLYSDLNVFIKANKKEFRHLYKAFFNKEYEVEDRDRRNNNTRNNFKNELVATALRPERMGKLHNTYGSNGVEWAHLN